MCRSPFQAMMVDKIVVEHQIKIFDLIYYNPEISKKDRLYFDRICSRARKSVLFSRYSLSGWLEFRRIGTKNHGSLFIANHTFSLFRALIARKHSSEIYSFDEGGGNFDPNGALQVDRRSFLERARDHVIGAPAALVFFAKAVAHYTVDARLPNVLPSEKLRQVDFGMVEAGEGNRGSVNLLIGQPFSEYLTGLQIEILHDAFKSVPDAKYVPHPREDLGVIPAQFTILEDERILEEVIFSLRATGKKIRLIGCSSTVFATIRGNCIEKYSMEVADDQERVERMQKMGAKTFDLSNEAERAAWYSMAGAWSQD